MHVSERSDNVGRHRGGDRAVGGTGTLDAGGVHEGLRVRYADGLGRPLDENVGGLGGRGNGLVGHLDDGEGESEDGDAEDDEDADEDDDGDLHVPVLLLHLHEGLRTSDELNRLDVAGAIEVELSDALANLFRKRVDVDPSVGRLVVGGLDHLANLADLGPHELAVPFEVELVQDLEDRSSRNVVELLREVCGTAPNVEVELQVLDVLGELPLRR